MDDRFFDENRDKKYRSFKEVMDEKRNAAATVKNEELSNWQQCF